jgi:hypothetical protein
MVALETLRHNLRRYRGRIESDIGAAPTDVRPEAARGSQFCAAVFSANDCRFGLELVKVILLLTIVG